MSYEIFLGTDLKLAHSTGKPIKLLNGKEYIVNKQCGGYKNQSPSFYLTPLGKNITELTPIGIDELFLEKTENDNYIIINNI